MDELKLCPKCAHDRIYALVGAGLIRCKRCGFKAVSGSFIPEKRPSLKWDEAREIPPYE
jgi:ribosomal protein L37AE/L43A